MLFPKIDSVFPASLSEIFIKKILKGDCRYKGLVVTDDLGMKALTNRYSTEEIAVRALQAGVDLLLYCNDFEAPPKAFEALINACANGPLDPASVIANSKKILQYKQTHLQNPDPLPWHEASQVVGADLHKKLSQGISDGILPEGLLLDQNE